MASILKVHLSMQRLSLKTIIATSLVLIPGSGGTVAEDISFDRDIRPLLSNRCFACHGPDAESRQADLRLDKPNSESAVIVPGSIADSEMWRRITSDD